MESETWTQSAQRLLAEVQRATDRKHAMKTLAKGLTDLLGASGTVVWLIDDEREHLHVEAAEPPEVWPSIRKVTIGLEDKVSANAQAVRDQTPVVIEDAINDSRGKKWLVKQFGIKSMLCVPLTAGDEALGSISIIQTDRFRLFTDTEVKLAADLAAGTGEQMRSFDHTAADPNRRAAIERQARTEKTIAAISSRFVDPDDIDQAINYSLADLGRLTQSSRAYMFLFDESAGTMSNTHEWAAPGVAPQIGALQGLPFDTFSWWIARLRRNETIHVPDVSKLPAEAEAEREILERQDIRSVLVLPVWMGGEPAGFLGFDHTVEPRLWTEDEITLLRVASEIIGTALEGQRAEEALTESKRKTADILESITDGFMAVDRQFRLTYVNRTAEGMLGQDRSRLLGRNFWKVFPEARESAFFTQYHEAMASQEPVAFQEFYRPLNMWVDVHAYPYKDGLSIYFSDITERKQAEEALGQSEEKYRKLMDMANDAIFLADVETGYIIDANRAASRLIGRPLEEIIGMHQMDLHPPEEAENYRLIFQKYVGKIAGVTEEIYAIHRSGRKIPIEISSSVVELGDRTVIQGIFRDVTERKRAKQLSDALNEINAVLNSTLDFDRIMETVVGEAAKAMGSDSVALSLRENERWVVKYLYGELPSELLGTRFSDRQVRGAGSEFEPGRPIVSFDAYNDARFERRHLEKFDIRSYLAVPVVIKDRPIGVLAFYHHREPVPFTEPRVDFAIKLAAAVSLALENARLYAEERSVADTLQKSLLTMPEKLPGLRFGHLYQSATGLAGKIGGDFYDLFELTGDRIGIVIGDVSGKGLEAATLTALIKNTVRAYAYQGDQPGLALAKANDVIYRLSPPEVFATIFFGVIEPKARSLIYTTAGHPPAMLIRKSGRVARLRTGPRAIGVFPALDYPKYRQAFSGGDRLFLYTNGLIEGRQREHFFGEERLLETVEELIDSDPEDLPSLVFDRLRAFTGGQLSDDMALLAIGLDDRKKG
jgi:PAS domain S-box-containing protein